MKLRSLFFAILALFCVFSTQAQEPYNIPTSGNSYVTTPPVMGGRSGRISTHGVRITNNGVQDWSGHHTIISTYFKVEQAGSVQLALKATATENAVIKVTAEGVSNNVHLSKSDVEQTINVGEIKVNAPGYVRVDMQGISRAGDTFANVSALVVSGDGTKSGIEFVPADFSSHFGRRGPSVHLNYMLPQGRDFEWFYNEITVPVGEDVEGSYFMANGFGEGYFGMQVNSPTERRVLFSVWSPYTTNRPSEIPDSMKIVLLGHGKEVNAGEFGGEGSGGQSRMTYMWKAGTTYKFLNRIQPTGKGSTIYTAYFYTPEEGRWFLIAQFERPLTDKHYTRPHSFLENFMPAMGYLSRKAVYNNQWARTVDGEWIELTKARFTADETGKKMARMDYRGGVATDGSFYMENGGFFNDYTEIGKIFERPATGRAPQVDLNKLPIDSH